MLLFVTLDTGTLRKCLKPDSIPSKFYWTAEDKKAVLLRRKRATRRGALLAEHVASTTVSDIDVQEEVSSAHLELSKHVY